MNRLQGKVAVVTGASKGIGAAIAEQMAAEGAAVVVNYASSKAGADAVVTRIREHGGKAVAVQADVQNLADHPKLISAALDNFGGLNILINNAGLEYRESFLTTTEAQFDHNLGVNLKGVYFLSQKAAQAMIKAGKGGKIVNISSCHDTVPLSKRSAYGVSKGGLLMLTKSLALELADYKINVNGMSPGAILTEMNSAALSVPEVRNRLLGMIPWNRLGDSEDCVGAVVFLASPDADYVTGTTLYADGGLLLRKL
jgi:glucose 1-dehydrogenase